MRKHSIPENKFIIKLAFKDRKMMMFSNNCKTYNAVLKVTNAGSGSLRNSKIVHSIMKVTIQYTNFDTLKKFTVG